MQAIFFPFQKTEGVMISKEEETVHKARNKEIDEQARPFRQKIAAIDKPVRERLLNEKVEFHVQLAEMSSGFEGKTKEQYREETAKRFAKDVNLQPEEIEALLSPEDLKARKGLQQRDGQNQPDSAGWRRRRWASRTKAIRAKPTCSTRGLAEQGRRSSPRIAANPGGRPEPRPEKSPPPVSRMDRER